MDQNSNVDNFFKTFKGCILGYGHFNTIHHGHIRYLKHARSLKNKFVIAVIGDKNDLNLSFTQSERIESLKLLKLADEIFPLEGHSLDELIKKLKPSTLILGNEYQDNNLLKNSIKIQYKLGGKVKFHAGDVHYATSDLLEKSQEDLYQKRKSQFLSACQNQNIKLNELFNNIKKWEETRLIVIGDTIVDQYMACEAIGMSAEAPVVVVRELENRNFIGGAGVVASHINALGAKCDLVSVIGDDETGKFVKNQLSNLGIGNSLVFDDTRPTTFKKRYLVENQKIFRVSRMNEHDISKEIEEKIINKLDNLATKAKGIVVSDFVYGVITPRILDYLNYLSKKYNLFLFGDLQCSSQVGSILKFKNFSLLCPNEREARIALQDKDCGLEHLSNNIIKKTGCKNLVMKIGSEGFISYERNKQNELNSQSFPALSINPIDVAGAGDSLLALVATALSSGQSLMPTSSLACCIASIAVETMGNSSISSTKLKEKLLEIMN